MIEFSLKITSVKLMYYFGPISRVINEKVPVFLGRYRELLRI